MKRTGPTNPNLKGLIRELRRISSEKNVRLWKRVAFDLEKPTRQKRIINLSRINRYAKENETIVVPGKVLGSGLLNHKVTIAAYGFSNSALEKINKADSKAMKIEELMKESVKGKRIRIMG